MRFNPKDPSFQDKVIDLNRMIDQTSEKMFGDMNAQKRNVSKRLATMLLIFLLYFVGPVAALIIILFALLRVAGKKISHQRKENQAPGKWQNANPENYVRNSGWKPPTAAFNREKDRASAITGERRRETASIRQQKQEGNRSVVLPLEGLEKQLAQLEGFYKNGLMEKEEYLSKRRRLLNGR